MPPLTGTSQTRAERVVASIRDQIIRGQLRPGERLIESTLAEHHHVARSTTREALQRLASMGFVVGEPNKGFAVREFTPEDVVGLGEVLALLEVRALRSVSFPLSPHTVAAMRESAELMDTLELPHDLDRMCELDQLFHGSLVEASGRPWLVDAWRRQGQLLSVMVVPLLHTGGSSSGRTQRSRHLKLLELAASGDKPAFESALSAHYYQPNSLRNSESPESDE